MSEQTENARRGNRNSLATIIDAMYVRFNRPPTEDEIMTFIYGTEEERLDVWNFGKRPYPG